MTREKETNRYKHDHPTEPLVDFANHNKRIKFNSKHVCQKTESKNEINNYYSFLTQNIHFIAHPGTVPLRMRKL